MLLEDVVKGSNVGIAEAGSAFGLLEKTKPVERVGAQRGSETLEGDGALEFGVLGAVDLAHATFSEPVADAEPSHDGAG